ncbi:BMP/retinoic acid-inducible neural-specific protein 3 [Acipenser ruthenus]|uniref:BMP/retinoic acid-inducible neural-specific protein 3 n=1 Tax=Acipenser ruthenus TaxID=7906 RepID=A0A444U9L3_ACIRT|nr:BMP/retinoic acid-inducible neural-specific protein 3 [Acipenser ruthenus]
MQLCWQCSSAARWLSLMLLWQWAVLGHLGWFLVLAAAPDQHATSTDAARVDGHLDWLLFDRGPFHRSPEYTDFKERFQQGFTTRYKIYREFSHWKVNNLAAERRDYFKAPLPLTPEFIRNLRLLGRRPSLQQINENLIRKYGTHFLVSAILGGLQGILPEFLQNRFVEAALSYVACNSEGELLCRNNDCWCQCSGKFPECNCPSTDINVMEDNLRKSKKAWASFNADFEESDEYKVFLKRLPTDRFLNTSVIFQFWMADTNLQRRYGQLETSSRLLLEKAKKIVRKLFTLSKRCPKQPKISLPRERPLSFWLNRAQSLLYCNEHSTPGIFSEEVHGCTCPFDQTACQGTVPCMVADAAACSSCAPDNLTRCGSCNQGYLLLHGACKPKVADSLDHYINFDSEKLDAELKYLLQHLDSRVEVHAIYISNDIRLGSWFDPAWRKRMLLTLKSNKNKSNLIHMLMGISFQICSTRNSTLEPVPAIYVNPFGGSHSESWFMPVNQQDFPDWERTKLDDGLQCYNWTLMMGTKWRSFFETVHIYLRSRIRSDDPSSNETLFYEPLDPRNGADDMGYMKINSIKVFGYSMHFDPEGIRDLIMQLDYPYTHGSQDSAFLLLLEMRERVNRLSPHSPQRLDLFSCLLRHRLKLSTSEVVRIRDSLQAFSSKLPNTSDQELIQLCS